MQTGTQMSVSGSNWTCNLHVKNVRECQKSRIYRDIFWQCSPLYQFNKSGWTKPKSSDSLKLRVIPQNDHSSELVRSKSSLLTSLRFFSAMSHPNDVSKLRTLLRIKPLQIWINASRIPTHVHRDQFSDPNLSRYRSFACFAHFGNNLVDLTESWLEKTSKTCEPSSLCQTQVPSESVKL